MQRRTFIRNTLLGLSSAPLSAAAFERVPFFRSTPFTLGIASGDVTHDSAVLWTRLAPDPDQASGGMPEDSVTVTWELAQNRSMSPLLREGQVLATNDLAHSVHVDVTGLDPATSYYYRFRVGDYTSPVGRTQTLPSDRDALESRFVTASCQNYTHGHFVAYKHIVADQPDFVIHLGDYLYETSFGETFRSHPADEDPKTLDEFRRWHAHYKSDPFLRQAHAALPFFHCIDNHDAIADNNPALAAVRAAAYQAWYEHMPVRGYPGLGLNAFDQKRRIQLGSLAQICLLDSRQFRDPVYLCEDYDPNFGFGNYRERCAGALAQDRSMLGLEQERWLSDSLQNNQSDWNVVASPGPFLPFSYQVDGRDLRYVGAWDNYPANRRRVADALLGAQRGHPLIISGDVHSFWAVDGSAIPWEDERFAITEFVTSSISANWPEALAKPVSDNLSHNPQVDFYDPAHRGYLLHELNADRWLTTMRGVADVYDVDAGVRSLATFAVEHGQPGFSRR